MEDDLITTKEVGDYRIKVYYCRDSECPITNWGLFGSFFFEYSDMHQLHDECNWKTFFYDNKHDLRDVIDAIVMKHIEQKDIVKYLKKGEANGISFTYNRGSNVWELKHKTSPYIGQEFSPSDLTDFDCRGELSDTGNMRFVASKLESIKKSIEKYKRAKTELSYTDIWGAFGNMMDYIQFFNMGTAKSILEKSANDWLGTNHELSKSEDSIKRKHVHELKRIFQILLDHQGLKVLGTVNVIVDEVCGEGTWIKYSERSERWRKGEEERERIKLERLRKEEEARHKDFDEKLEEWKSGEINFLNTPFYIPGEKPNAWIRIKGNIIETSKQIKIGITEARKLWRAVSAMHRGAEFRHGLVEDITGHQWSLNRYENDLLTAGCHRIAYNEMERQK